MLILAGITINQLTENGLFEKAQLAKEKSENAKIKENEILNDYENTINEEVVGSREQITANNATYSTSEQVIGTWINGKNIYRKVVPVTITGVTPHGISNMDVLVKYSLTWYDIVDNAWYDRLRLWEDNYGVAMEMNVTNTDISIGTNRTNTIDWASRTSKAYAILEYTKTTD